jgi:carbon-monoxide dehydrogenase large subunit
MGNQEYGTGLVTSYKQLVSDQLGVDPDRIDVIMGDTDRTPAGLTGGSRAIAGANRRPEIRLLSRRANVRMCATKIQDRAP